MEFEPEEKPVTFGERLHQLRTMPELAEKSGLRPMCIVRLEQGEVNNPDLETIRKLARGLRVGMSEFFEGVE